MYRNQKIYSRSLHTPLDSHTLLCTDFSHARGLHVLTLHGPSDLPLSLPTISFLSPWSHSGVLFLCTLSFSSSLLQLTDRTLPGKLTLAGLLRVSHLINTAKCYTIVWKLPQRVSQAIVAHNSSSKLAELCALFPGIQNPSTQLMSSSILLTILP